VIEEVNILGSLTASGTDVSNLSIWRNNARSLSLDNRLSRIQTPVILKETTPHLHSRKTICTVELHNFSIFRGSLH